MILIGGDITDSTSPYARKGAREVIVIKRGSPVYADFDSEGRDGGDVMPAASLPGASPAGHGHRNPNRHRPGWAQEPLEGGTVELGP